MGIWRIGEERRRREKEEGREGGRVEEGKVKYMYRIVPGKHPWALAAQAPKIGVGPYTESLLECLNHMYLTLLLY